MRRSVILLAPAWVATALLILTTTPGAAQVQKVETRTTTKTTTVVDGKTIREEALRLRMMAAPPFPAPVVQGVEGVPGRAAREAMAAQFIRQVRPILRAELHLIRTVCKTSEEEQRALAREGEEALKLAVDKFAEIQVKAQQGQAISSTMPDVPKQIHSALAAAVKAKLSPEKAERYRAELDERARVRREVTARNLVAKLDQLLNLAPEQRAKIAAALEKSADSLASTVDTLIHNSSYYPNLPPNQVVPFLDERQKAIWNNTQKVTFGSSNLGIVGLNLSEHDLAEEDDPAAAAEAAKARRAATLRRFLNNLGRILPGAKAALPQAPAAVRGEIGGLITDTIEFTPAPARPMPPPAPAPPVRPVAK